MTLRLWGDALAPKEIAPEDGIAIGPALRKEKTSQYAPQSTLKLWGESPSKSEQEVKVRFEAPPADAEEPGGGQGARGPSPVWISWRKPSEPGE